MGWRKESFSILSTCCGALGLQWLGFFCPKLCTYTHLTVLYTLFPVLMGLRGDPLLGTESSKHRDHSQSTALEPYGNTGLQAGCRDPPGIQHCNNFHHKNRTLPCLQSQEQGEDTGMASNPISRGTPHCQMKPRVEKSSFSSQLEKRGSKNIATLKKSFK